MIIKASSSDFKFIYGLYMHPQVNRYLLYEPMDAEAFEPIFADLLAKEILYIYTGDERPTGMFKLVRHLHRNAHIGYLGSVAIHPDFAGKGYGYKMLQEIIAIGQNMGLLRIELSTATVNNRAIQLYEKAGFHKEGVLKKFTYLKNENQFLDEVMMAYLY
jgi:L-phenylalanine/L-methionine N-acetyltransferase